jgi:hypothetical protein
MQFKARVFAQLARLLAVETYRPKNE